MTIQGIFVCCGPDYHASAKEVAAVELPPYGGVSIIEIFFPEAHMGCEAVQNYIKRTLVSLEGPMDFYLLIHTRSIAPINAVIEEMETLKGSGVIHADMIKAILFNEEMITWHGVCKEGYLIDDWPFGVLGY